MNPSSAMAYPNEQHDPATWDTAPGLQLSNWQLFGLALSIIIGIIWAVTVLIK
jgi:hypothetical protein